MKACLPELSCSRVKVDVAIISCGVSVAKYSIEIRAVCLGVCLVTTYVLQVFFV